MRPLAFALPALMLAVTLGCGDRRNREVGGVNDTDVSAAATPTISDAAPEARDFTYDERQGFAESIRQQLADLDGRIQQLSAEAKSQGGAVSDRALSRIRASRRAADRNLSKIANASADDWDELKLNTNQAVETLNEAIEAALPK